MEHPDDLLALLGSRSAQRLTGAGIGLLQHSWQCARLAAQAHATAELQLACWLHDIGHLLLGSTSAPAEPGADDRHEQVAARVLEPFFGPAVSQPIALHVQAKRYMVAMNPRYAHILSFGARRRLTVQGGAMDAREAGAFMAHPLAGDALRLRAWDECAQLPDWRPASAESALAELAELMNEVRAQVA